MGRQQWIPDSARSGNPATFPSNNILPAFIDGTVAAGELCAIHESGLIRRVDPTLPWSAINQNSETALTIVEDLSIENLVISGGTTTKTCGYPVRLINKTTIIPVQTGSGIGFIIRTSSGLEVANFILASADNSVVVPYAIELANGNFALLWHTGANFKHMVFSPLGVVVQTVTVIASNVYVAGSVPWHGRCNLANGNFVVSWCDTSQNLKAQIYSNVGIAVGSVITIDTGINAGFHALTKCANGDFVVTCFETTHSRHKIYRVTNAGAVSWGPITPSTASAIFSQPDGPRIHQQHNRIIELSNGNLAWMLPNASTYANAYVLSNLGSTLQQVDFGTLYHDSGVAAPIVLTPNGFAVAHTPNGSLSTYMSTYDVSGNCLVQNSLVDDGLSNGNVATAIPQGQTSIVNTYIGFSGAGLSISRYHQYNGNNVEHRLLHCDHRGGLIGVPLTIKKYANVDIYGPTPSCDTNGIAFLAYFSTEHQTIKISVTKVGRSSVLGVAQATQNTSGGAITLSCAGAFALPSTQVFGPGNAFDQRQQPVRGAQGIVGGSSALLYGL